MLADSVAIIMMNEGTTPRNLFQILFFVKLDISSPPVNGFLS
jgi:hypothetical protein